MKRGFAGYLLAGLAALAVAGPTSAFAEETMAEEEENDWLPGSLSGNVGLTSDYIFRGVSQTQESIALQGGIDWTFDSGFYVGTWGSSIKFAGDDSFLEQDFYGGYAGSIGENFSYDFFATFFYYPKEEDYNYWEFAGSGSYDFGPLAVNAGVLWSPDYFGTLDSGWYASTGVAVPIPLDLPVGLSVDANVGYTNTSEDIFDDDDYWDWNVGLVVELPKNLSLDLRYHDTDVNGVDDADSRFVAGVFYSF